ncbi:MAG: 50S ribosomal protein L19 [Candidatus Delongbacteria bacterium]|nr:50S ribosomal protein L19 [Candidatus Delongbacteria bacterium]
MDKVEAALPQTKDFEIPDIDPGDTLEVHVWIREGDKERIQVFTGTVIQMKGKGNNSTVTVAKTSNGVKVERIFPLYSHNIDKMVIQRKGKVRRARLYYLRERTGKAARIKEKKRD